MAFNLDNTDRDFDSDGNPWQAGDGGEDPPRDERGPRRRPLRQFVLLGIVLLACLGFGLVMWDVYQLQSRRGSDDLAPLIRADRGPIRVEPEQPGGMQVPHQDRHVLERGEEDGPPAFESLLPPPEEPMPRPMPEPVPEPVPSAAMAEVEPEPQPEPQPEPGLQPGAPVAEAVPPGQIEETRAADTGSAAAEAADPPATAPAPPAAGSAANEDLPPLDTAGLDALLQRELGERLPAAAGEAPELSVNPMLEAGDAVPGAETLPPRSPSAQPAAEPPAPVTESTAVPAPPTQQAALPPDGGTHAVQVAAVPSQEAVQSEWQRFQRQYGDLLGSVGLMVRPFDRDGQTWYRLWAGPVDQDAADRICGELKARGGDCLVRRL